MDKTHSAAANAVEGSWLSSLGYGLGTALAMLLPLALPEAVAKLVYLAYAAAAMLILVGACLAGVWMDLRSWLKRRRTTLGSRMALSAISAYLCIKLFLSLFGRIGMLHFTVYRLALGSFLFLVFWQASVCSGIGQADTWSHGDAHIILVNEMGTLLIRAAPILYLCTMSGAECSVFPVCDGVL